MDALASPEAVYALLLIVLIAAGLIARRLPLRQYAKMIGAWIAIFFLIFVIFSFRPEMAMMWDRVKGELTGAPRQSMEGDKLRLVRKDDGHFWLRASINGVNADFMVDSGATVTAMGDALARKTNVELDGRKILLETANGQIEARTGNVAEFRIGDFQVDDFDVVVGDNFGDVNVVGMNFLDSFSSWRVQGDVMELTP
ncbi:MAG: TIGR02281 family clan AA aspartic protease [Sphingomonadales bacterium]|jgi:aspartyl protease family protein|nr:TIGR02281 family clan AA aspartic protease [Sphingomonadales bacterium]